MSEIGVMLFAAMPLTALSVTLLEWLRPEVRHESFVDLFGSALFLVYVWGVVTGVAVSLIHRPLVDAVGKKSLVSFFVAGAALGVIGGVVTPTMFTGFGDRDVTLWGGFTGATFGLMTWFLIRRTNEATD
jgi:hypothetical protein